MNRLRKPIYWDHKINADCKLIVWVSPLPHLRTIFGQNRVTHNSREQTQDGALVAFPELFNGSQSKKPLRENEVKSTDWPGIQFAPRQKKLHTIPKFFLNQPFGERISTWIKRGPPEDEDVRFRGK